MNKLDIDAINSFSPYDVIEENERLYFKTDNNITYLISFDEEDNPFYTAYWFNLTNATHTASPGDKKIAQTVICIKQS